MHDIKRYLKKSYRRLEERLDNYMGTKDTLINKKHLSTTDPDASVTRDGKSRPKLRYKTHRVPRGIINFDPFQFFCK